MASCACPPAEAAVLNLQPFIFPVAFTPRQLNVSWTGRAFFVVRDRVLVILTPCLNLEQNAIQYGPGGFLDRGVADVNDFQSLDFIENTVAVVELLADIRKPGIVQ